VGVRTYYRIYTYVRTPTDITIEYYIWYNILWWCHDCYRI